MERASITQYIPDTFAEVEMAATRGYTLFCYGSEHKLPFASNQSDIA
jgi:hypothetical protein